jgi:hypothetical protein
MRLCDAMGWMRDTEGESIGEIRRVSVQYLRNNGKNIPLDVLSGVPSAPVSCSRLDQSKSRPGYRLS